ncbi:unnamed protein product [Peniophora sp. CBMAI 1063]|nr:unnamed protein product [Peniophora sp. CBMAI 1063]
MSGSASFDLGPPEQSAGSLFLKSQFLTSPQWPPADTNLSGKVAIVTGSSSGLGLEASRQLLSFGLSTLIMAVRSPGKGEDVATTFRTEFPEADVRVWPLEMESYASIQDFARRVDAELPRLDIAILNAALQMANHVPVTSTGHEKLIQVNYLSTTLLAILLLPLLKAKSSDPRLSIVSSGTARGASLNIPPGTPILPSLDDQTKPYDPVERYAVSKLLGHLFLLELVLRYVRAEDVVVNLVDPGLVKNTDLQRGAPFLIDAFFTSFKAIFGRTVPVGASTYVDAVAVKGKESHGCFLSNWKISPFAAFLYTPEGEAARKQLWKETMEELEFASVEAILDDLKSLKAQSRTD